MGIHYRSMAFLNKSLISRFISSFFASKSLKKYQIGRCCAFVYRLLAGISISAMVRFVFNYRCVSDMTAVIIKQADDVVFQGLCEKLSPLGCECVLPLDLLQRFREECGRYKAFSIELSLHTHDGHRSVRGGVTVYSLHRKSQTECLVCFRFADMESAAHRWIAEHLSQPLKAISFSQATPASATKPDHSLPNIRLA